MVMPGPAAMLIVPPTRPRGQRQEADERRREGTAGVVGLAYIHNGQHGLLPGLRTAGRGRGGPDEAVAHHHGDVLAARSAVVGGNGDGTDVQGP